ncbi:MAG: AAA family ATPase, partial [bacterium]
YAWFVPANKDERSPGAQIDLLLTRRDGVVTICEIKFSHGEYEIDKDYDMNLRNKVSVFEKAQIQKNHFSS